MSLPRYPKYKASGVEWLGDVPEHWQVRRLKHVCEAYPSNVDKKSHEGEQAVLLCNYTDVYYNDRITADLPFMAASASQDQIEKFTLRAGDTVITKDSETADDIAVSAYVPDDLPGVVCGYHLSVVRPRATASGGFVKRLFDSAFSKATVAVRANGLTRVGLSQYDIDNVEWPWPPPGEQAAIVAFLDRETAKIDALIAEQQRLVELLKEKRQASISHAVTKGLNPDVPMKESGIEWLPKIPAHWAVLPLKLVADVKTGVAKGKDHGERATVRVPYLRVANVQNGYLDLSEVATIDIPVEDLARQALRPGDVLMNEGGDFDKLGRGCVWDGQIDPCITQNHVFAVRPHNVSPAWLSAITDSDYAQFYFMTRSKQSTNLASISSTNLMDLPVVLPPDVEQKAILGYIAHDSKRSGELLSVTEAALELLKERRQALISSAVTGQIDLRDFAPEPGA